MPLINGCKYSCEPCIRGHRATSCTHTDRILIEVRKPGRPLESCGHEFATCNCGKITELLSMGTVISHPAPQQGDSTLVVTSPPLASVKAKSKDRSKSNHRVSKRPKKNKGESSPTSQTPSTSRGSRETSSMLEEAEPNVDPPSFAYQDQIYPGGPGGLTPGTQPPSFAPYPSPTYQTMQTMPPIQGAQTFGPYQAGQTFNNPDAYQMAYSPQPPQSQAGYSVGYSSRIEDVARGPSGQQENADPNQPQIRSQYIMARQDSVWRATH